MNLAKIPEELGLPRCSCGASHVLTNKVWGPTFVACGRPGCSFYRWMEIDNWIRAHGVDQHRLPPNPLEEP